MVKGTEVTMTSDMTSDDYWAGVDSVKAGIGAIVKFEDIGTVFVGTYQGMGEVTTEDGEIIEAHKFNDPDGLPVAIWASHDLNRKLEEVPNYSPVRIEYIRDVPTKRGLTPMKEFKVQAKF
jgi:hypothetical protein